MDGGVLADLERGEVEPEGRQLPAQLGDLAPGDPAQRVLDQRVLERCELGVERRGVRVAARPRAGLVGQRRPSPAQALRDRAQPLAVWLLGEAAAELADDLGQLLGVAGKRAAQATVDVIGRNAGRDGLHQPRRDGLVAPQQMVGLEAGGVERDLRGHPGMPIAIGSDP